MTARKNVNTATVTLTVAETKAAIIAEFLEAQKVEQAQELEAKKSACLISDKTKAEKRAELKGLGLDSTAIESAVPSKGTNAVTAVFLRAIEARDFRTFEGKGEEFKDNFAAFLSEYNCEQSKVKNARLHAGQWAGDFAAIVTAYKAGKEDGAKS